MLYLFDVDGTLARSFMREGGGGAAREYDLIEILPRRLWKLHELALDPRGSRFGLVTNQGGVAFGYQTVDQVYRKLGGVIAGLACFFGRPLSVHVCFEHPQATIDQFRADSLRRKPGPGMLREAMQTHYEHLDPWRTGRGPRDFTTFVGDMETDAQAAKAAGVKYVDAEEFFA